MNVYFVHLPRKHAQTFKKPLVNNSTKAMLESNSFGTGFTKSPQRTLNITIPEPELWCHWPIVILLWLILEVLLRNSNVELEVKTMSSRVWDALAVHGMYVCCCISKFGVGENSFARNPTGILSIITYPEESKFMTLCSMYLIRNIHQHECSIIDIYKSLRPDRGSPNKGSSYACLWTWVPSLEPKWWKEKSGSCTLKNLHTCTKSCIHAV